VFDKTALSTKDSFGPWTHPLTNFIDLASVYLYTSPVLLGLSWDRQVFPLLAKQLGKDFIHCALRTPKGMGKYSTYGELRRGERNGVDYRIHTRRGDSGIAVIAPHGGGIEPGTMETASEVAGNEHAFYCFEGVKTRGNSDLHITSKNVDEPTLLSILKDAKVAIALHGCGTEDEAVYIGGLHSDLKQRIHYALTRAGFTVKQSLKPLLQGKSAQNICNMGKTGAGVQLELSRGLRRQMFVDVIGSQDQDRSQRTEVFYAFVSALRKALSENAAKTAD
jgi:phage replication-related protein YjqB (UPF0714/DUF867 family)